MIPSRITVKFPADFIDWANSSSSCPFDKVAVVSTIRSLTGWGLKEAKDAAESRGPVVLPIKTMTEKEYQSDILILTNNGVTFSDSFHDTIRGNLENMAKEAIQRREYGLATSLLEFIRDKL